MLKKFIPILTWLPAYQSRDLKGDVSAGLTVGVMLIPQGMAYAMLAGMPPIYGLYASIIPLILYAIFGTSRQLAVGPVAMVSLLISSGVGALADPSTQEYIGLAILLALMVGIFQLMLGVLRLGFLVNYLSHPVISGFTSAAALIIGLSQLKHLMGIEIPRSHYIHEVLIDAAGKVGETHLPTLILGLIAIALTLGLKRISKAIPGPLVLVVLGILAVYFFGLAEGGMKIVGKVPDGLPSPEIPMVEFSAMGDLFSIALTISLIGFMESFAVAKALQSRHKDYDIDANQELIGLGVANIGGAFFQAFPTTGGFGRSAVNDQSGARTGLASIISAVFIALTLVFLTPLFFYLPKAILASVIMVAVFGLIDFKEVVHLWKTDKSDFAMLVATFLATLTLGIEQGIGVGVALSLLVVIYRSAYPHVAILGRIKGTSYYRNLNRFKEAEDRPDILVIRFDAQMYFANSNFFRAKLVKLVEEKGDKLELVVVNAESMSFLDSTAVQTLHDMVRDLKGKNITLYMAGVIGPVRDILYRSHLLDELGKGSQYMHVHEAIEFWDQKGKSGEASHGSGLAYQTNVSDTH